MVILLYISEGEAVLNLKIVIKSYKMLSSSNSKNKQFRGAALACYDFQNLF